MASEYIELKKDDYYTKFYNTFLRSNNSLPINNLWVVFINGIPLNLHTQYGAIEPRAERAIDVTSLVKAKQHVKSKNGVLIAQAITEVGDGVEFTREGYKNGGYLMGVLSNHRTPSNHFKISFLETDTSFIDTVIRPWIITLSYKGLTEGSLLANNITIVHLSKSKQNLNNDAIQSVNSIESNSTDVPSRINSFKSVASLFKSLFSKKIKSVISDKISSDISTFVPRKIFTYYNCFPIGVEDTEYNYSGDDVVKRISVNFGFTSYVVQSGNPYLTLDAYTQPIVGPELPVVGKRTTDAAGFFDKLKNKVIDGAKTYVKSLENQLVGGIANSIEGAVTDSISSVVRNAESVGIGVVNGINTVVGNATGKLSSAVDKAANKLAADALNKLDISKNKGTSINTNVQIGVERLESTARLKATQKNINTNDTVTFTVRNEFISRDIPTPPPEIKTPNSFDTPELIDFVTINENESGDTDSNDTLNYSDYDQISKNVERDINENDTSNFLTLPNNNKQINKNDTVSFIIRNNSNKTINKNDTPNSLTTNGNNIEINKNDTPISITNNKNNIEINKNDTPISAASNINTIQINKNDTPTIKDYIIAEEIGNKITDNADALTLGEHEVISSENEKQLNES